MADHHEKMNVLIEGISKSLHEKLDKAISSGALEEELIEADDFRLVKSVFTAYMRNEPYGPWTDTLRKTVKNLEHFI